VQEVTGAGSETGALVYWNNRVYTTGQGSPVKIWSLSNGLLSTTPAVKTSQIFTSEHAPVLSSNGTSNGILWQLNGGNLTAYDALTLKVLYQASQSNGRDSLPTLPHFGQLMQVNGKIYVGANSSLVVFGLL